MSAPDTRVLPISGQWASVDLSLHFHNSVCTCCSLYLKCFRHLSLSGKYFISQLKCHLIWDAISITLERGAASPSRLPDTVPSHEAVLISTWRQNSWVRMLAPPPGFVFIFAPPAPSKVRSGCSISGCGIKPASSRPCWVLTLPCDYIFLKHTLFIICKSNFASWKHSQRAVCWLV